MPTYQHKTEKGLKVTTTEGSPQDRKYASRKSSWERVNDAPKATKNDPTTKND